MWPHIWYPAHTYAYKLLWAFSNVPFSKYWEIEYFLHISKQGCHSHQWWQPSSVSCWALRELRKENTCRLAAIRPQPLLMVSPEERKLRKWKHRKLAPYSQGAYQRNDFSEPRLLYLLMFRKALNSLTWNIWFPLKVKSESESHSVVSGSLRPHVLYNPWNSPGQNTGVGSLSLLQGIFSTQGSNSGLLHCRQIFTSWATINSNLLVFRLPALCCKLLYNLVPPLPPQSSSLRVSWDAVSQARIS